jgi:alkanesulfonate monooxygenase SsuD/methylene tetrahydromethanopterin reductase-like flavin-dependent oxidoreductase (luciferase family)
MVERARAAHEADLDSLFVGDHHATAQPYYQNNAILGRLLAEWGDRTFGALYLLPIWHPVLLAEQIGTLAALAPGSFVMQCAIGRADRQFDAMGVDGRHRPSRFEQSLELLRRLWAGEEVDADGRWRFSRARVSPVPSEPVDVWIGASAEPAIERAARLGDGWIAAPGLEREQARNQLDVYLEACARCGRAAGVRALRRDIYIGASPEEAQATAGPVLDAGYRGFPPTAPVVGSAEQVAERFATFFQMGYSDILVRNLAQEPEAALASTRRLAEVRRLLASS